MRFRISGKTYDSLVIGAVLVFILFLYASFKKWESDHYRQQMPAEIGLAEAILIDGESGFREGCGVAVFELAPWMKEQLRAHGLAALTNSQQRQIQGANTSAASDWKETPYVETGDGLGLEDRWTVGLSCVQQNSDIVRRINDALRQPGSFVKKQYEAGVIVIPSSGLAALVYFG